MALLFAYGILKNEGKLVIKDFEINATMYDLGAFPAITELDSGNKSLGNIIEVTDKDIEHFDIVEGVPHLYTRHTIDTPAGPAFIYVFARKHELNDSTNNRIECWGDKL